MNIPPDAPAPRLCHLVKWPDFDGYGFNLHGDKSKPGQYIGKVDKDSPAEWAGLKANDKIIEVNETNISNENHKQVVQRIKTVENETKLLVIDDKAEQYYKARNIVVTGGMVNVVYKKTPIPRPNTTTVVLTPINNETLNNGNNGSTHSDDERRPSRMSDNEGSYHSDGSSSPSKNSLKKDHRNGYSSSGSGGRKDSGERHHHDDMSSSSMTGECHSPTPSPVGVVHMSSMSSSSHSATPSPIPPMMRSSGGNNKNGLDLNMTAQEMRAKLAAKKKDKMDPKNQNIDLKKKYDIIQTL